VTAAERALQPAPRVAVIDYGIGNLRSVEKALQRAGADAFLTANAQDIASADGVMLPGVGAMGRCMESLDAAGLRTSVLAAIDSGRPFIGVCVGMQMLHAGSTEHGGVEGLGVFPSTVRAITPVAINGTTLRVPHMQWNLLQWSAISKLHREATPLWVYFANSFAADPHEHVVATVNYGGPISAIVERGALLGTQFHPEKSGIHGQKILRSFVSMCVP
jgi:imidazole glycerol-phosphate synthase subunit HisH